MSKPSKFGMLKNLSAAQGTEDAAPAIPQARDTISFTTAIDADLNRRLLLYVAEQKAVRRPGVRVSIKSVLGAALDEYLKKQGH